MELRAESYLGRFATGGEPGSLVGRTSRGDPAADRQVGVRRPGQRLGVERPRSADRCKAGRPKGPGAAAEAIAPCRPVPVPARQPSGPSRSPRTSRSPSRTRNSSDPAAPERSPAAAGSSTSADESPVSRSPAEREATYRAAERPSEISSGATSPPARSRRGLSCDLDHGEDTHRDQSQVDVDHNRIDEIGEPAA